MVRRALPRAPTAEINITPAPIPSRSSSWNGGGWPWLSSSELIVPFKRDVYRQVTEAFAPFARAADKA